jgi:predicted acetyltransferase
MYKLQFPNISHKSEYLAMIAEWKAFEITPTSPSRLFAGESYAEFLDIINLDLTDNPNGVNRSFYFFMENDTILGAINIRHHINHPLLRDWWGHIGYGLRPSARGKWLAKEMLTLGLIEAKKLWLEKVMIGANDDNPASWKTIESCGGIFEKFTLHEWKKSRVYWINI